MTQKICRCVRRLTVEDTCLHDVLGTIESLCESQVLWSKCPTTSSSFFINPWLNPIVIILRSHFRSLLRFFTRPYSPKYFLHNCAGTCGHVPAIIYSRMVSGKDAYIVHYFNSAYFSNEFGSLHSLRWWFRTKPIQVDQDFQDWVASSFTTPIQGLYNQTNW